MYQYNTKVVVVTKGGNTYTFEGDAGRSAARSLAEKKYIYAESEENIGKITFIPYEAVDNAKTMVESDEGIVIEDDICDVKRGVGTPETLNITNLSGESVGFSVFLKTNSPVTYGEYEFTTDASETHGSGWYSTDESIGVNEYSTITISGIPDGTQYHVVGNGNSYQGVIPADVWFSGGEKK